ncbi:aldo/keto reductase [Empedobacter sp. 225-1]|uniref:aldo/keto reductase n=1 Tax=unclassified Empedobacter TaxID=2643773 RepID=UPI002577C178|nr:MULTISPECIES: aldo/keto reductase [unclassified Empedobacter]MDM1523231.1 aldo/keto reductase [Empedobacter sp. 225-1]MDM1542195.1 aldo/keto reductase [Empedobacter sp. 189-2]
MKNFKISNGIDIPAIGFGTWLLEGEKVTEPLKIALEKGYTHIDTAAIYKNEKEIGVVLQSQNIDRKELFITSKCWNSERGYEKALVAFEQTLTDLQTDYLDLYLIHWPANETQFPDNWAALNASTWRAFEEIYTSGKAKAIGVSNFNINHLEALFETAKIKPMVNQIEIHPGHSQPELVDFCKQNDLLVQAWSPLGSGRILENELIVSLANKYNVSVGQICINYCLAKEILPLPRSSSEKNIEANLTSNNFKLSAEDIKAIDEMPADGFSGLNPSLIEF